MHESLEEFLDHVAQRGSWFGGGSAAALTSALAAALLEKVVVEPSVLQRLRRIRRVCVELIQRDATAFAAVIRAIRQQNTRAFRMTLQAATEVQWQVFECARRVGADGTAAQRLVKPRFQSDLRCAMAMARAAEVSARTLIVTNLAWLHDRSYTRAIRRRIQALPKHR